MTDDITPMHAQKLTEEDLQSVSGGTLPDELMVYFNMLDEATKAHADQYLPNESDQTSIKFLIEALDEAGLKTEARNVRLYYNAHYGTLS